MPEDPTRYASGQPGQKLSRSSALKTQDDMMDIPQNKDVATKF